MLKELLADRASLALTKSLQGAAARQEALASNIANIETPGYVRQDVRFEDALQGALDATPSSDSDTSASGIPSLLLLRRRFPAGQSRWEQRGYRTRNGRVGEEQPALRQQRHRAGRQSPHVAHCHHRR